MNAKIKPELDRREALAESQLTMMEKVIRTGYRKLAAELHPDNQETGNEDGFRRLKAAMEQFKVIMEEVKQADASGS